METVLQSRAMPPVPRSTRTPAALRGMAAVLALLAMLLVTACGQSDAAPSGPVAANQVEMVRSYRFAPDVIRIKAGDTVTWTNRDNFTHDVRLTGDVDWRSEPAAPGESITYTFTEPGEYAYECGFHSRNMTGTVIVEP